MSFNIDKILTSYNFKYLALSYLHDLLKTYRMLYMKIAGHNSKSFDTNFYINNM